MTPKEISDGTKLRLKARNQDFPVDERAIMWMADRVRSKLLGTYIRINGDQVRGEFTKSVVIDIQLDKVRNLKYIQANGNFINLPNGAGIMGIGYIQNDNSSATAEADQFIQTNVGDLTVYKGLEAENCGIEYWQETDRFYFNQLGYEVKQVLVKCIPSIMKLDIYNDQVSIPYITEDDLIEMLASKIMNQLPEDKSDDSRQTPE